VPDCWGKPQTILPDSRFGTANDPATLRNDHDAEPTSGDTSGRFRGPFVMIVGREQAGLA